MYFRLKPWQPKKESVRSAGSPSSLTTIFLVSLSMDRAMYGIVRQGMIVKIEHRVLLSTKTFCLICYFYHNIQGFDHLCHRCWAAPEYAENEDGVTVLALHWLYIVHCTLYIVIVYCTLYILYFMIYCML